jgi:putative endonuclease
MKFKRAKARHLRLGERGENLAAALLRSKNIHVLCRNYKVKAGEIDIVARDGAVLVFVEVKTSHKPANRPAANLRIKQKRRIYRAANNYLKAIGHPAVMYRFDLIEIVFERSLLKEARHWQKHFSGREIGFEKNY